jgi:hypothetical protein
MTNTFDPSTSIGKVRMFCLDKGLTSVFSAWVYSDEEILSYISMAEGGDLRLSGALALEDIASNQALLTKNKVKKVGDIELTTGVDMAKMLLQRAETLRESVNSGYAFAVI